MPVPTVKLFGVPISKLNMRETVEFLTDAIRSRRPHQVVTINPIIMMAGLENESFMTMLRNAELIVPDGTGVVWAAEKIGAPVAERVPGIELMHHLLSVGQSYGWKVYLLGTTPETIRITAEKLAQQYPDIRIVGVRDGYFGDAEDEEVIQDIVRNEPDLLFVGRSAMGQDPWIHKYKERLNVPLMMGIGGSFDVIAGKLKRAPVLFQKLRLEWLFRLLQEPSRYRRMFALPQFVVKVIREKENLQKQA